MQLPVPSMSEDAVFLRFSCLPHSVWTWFGVGCFHGFKNAGMLNVASPGKAVLPWIKSFSGRKLWHLFSLERLAQVCYWTNRWQNKSECDNWLQPIKVKFLRGRLGFLGEGRYLGVTGFSNKGESSRQCILESTVLLTLMKWSVHDSMVYGNLRYRDSNCTHVI